MKVLKSVIILFFVIFAHGCSTQSLSSNDKSTPEAVIANLIEATKTNKFEAARLLCHSSFIEELETRNGFHDFFAKGHSKLQELESYTITALARSDSEAKFKVYYTFSGGKREHDVISLKQENYAWLITDI